MQKAKLEPRKKWTPPDLKKVSIEEITAHSLWLGIDHPNPESPHGS